MPAEQPVGVTGSVTYGDRLARSATAQVEIRIDDVSLADAPSRTVARQSFTADGRQVPFAFRLTVDRRQLDPRGSFALSARITDASGRLMFITATHNSIRFADRPAIYMGTITMVKTHASAPPPTHSP